MFNYVTADSLLYKLILSGTLMLMLIISVSYYKINLKYKKLLGIIILFSIGSIIEVIIKGSFSFVTSFILLSGNVSIAYYLFKDKHKMPIVYYLYWGITLYFIVNMILGKNPKFLLSNLSSNHISVIILYLTTLYYVEKLRERKELSILPSLFYLVISIYAGGRSGILSSGFMLSGLVLFNKKSNKYLKFSVVLLFMIAVYLLFFSSAELKYELFEKFYRKSIEDEPRLNIINAYFSNLSIKSFLLGYETNYAYSFFHTGNLHNSFLVLHFRYGIIGIVSIALIIKQSIKMTVKKRYDLLILLGAIVLRAFTDTILLPYYYDFIIFYLLFSEEFKVMRGKNQLGNNGGNQYET